MTWFHPEQVPLPTRVLVWLVWKKAFMVNTTKEIDAVSTGHFENFRKWVQYSMISALAKDRFLYHISLWLFSESMTQISEWLGSSFWKLATTFACTKSLMIIIILIIPQKCYCTWFCFQNWGQIFITTWPP